MPLQGRTNGIALLARPGMGHLILDDLQGHQPDRDTVGRNRRSRRPGAAQSVALAFALVQFVDTPFVEINPDALFVRHRRTCSLQPQKGRGPMIDTTDTTDIDGDAIASLATDDHSPEAVLSALVQFGQRMDAESRADLVAETRRLNAEAQDS